mmetsp:Transcript_15991/g.18560  ORF Transcript_15991/g.18560 Transcript_15991/m.18560 type:complete len:107 (+) Transcript_15991:702-1022(+)
MFSNTDLYGLIQSFITSIPTQITKKVIDWNKPWFQPKTSKNETMIRLRMKMMWSSIHSLLYSLKSFDSIDTLLLGCVFALVKITTATTNASKPRSKMRNVKLTKFA